jgi:hypothetical protein
MQLVPLHRDAFVLKKKGEEGGEDGDAASSPKEEEPKEEEGGTRGAMEMALMDWANNEGAQKINVGEVGAEQLLNPVYPQLGSAPGFNP